MAYNFPDSPTVGQVYSGYTWDGEKWNGGGAATGPTGPTGLQGTAGTVGGVGSTGPTGAQGTAGTAGGVGATGPTGTAGGAGATGPTGAAAVNAREVLTATRNYYVSTTGNDSNNGLTVGTPFLTIQKAITTVCGLDTGVSQVTINVADGTYNVTGHAMLLKSYVGGGNISIVGNPTTPTNCVIAVTSGFPIYAAGVKGTWTIGGFHLRALTAGYDCVLASQLSVLNLNDIRFENVAGAHVHTTFGAGVFINNVNGNSSIVGNFNIHLYADSQSTIQEVGVTLTIVGTPAMSQGFIWCTQGSLVITNANTYVGSCTGPRYLVQSLSYVNTGTSGSATYLPGSVAGSVASGGIYD